jgi:hypothetical protein
VNEVKNRKSISDDLNVYDYLAKKEDFIEITEWSNEEGWDICIKDQHISLTIGQLDAINHLTNILKYHR